MKTINSKLKLLVKKLGKPGHSVYDSHDVRKVEIDDKLRDQSEEDTVILDENTEIPDQRSLTNNPLQL